jgi:predicted RecA/RadA family phage recombinase
MTKYVISSRTIEIVAISAILLGALLAIGGMFSIHKAEALKIAIGASGNSDSGEGGGGQSSSNSSSNSDSGQQYCYDTLVTNPFNGKTRTVNSCYDNREDCEQAQQHDSDAMSSCSAH